MMSPFDRRLFTTSNDQFRLQVEECVSFLKTRIGEPLPRILLILGTGLGEIADEIEAEHSIPYAELPYFPAATVQSHAGMLVIGDLRGQRVAALQGRFHYYEGYSTRELTFPIRVLSRLGIEIMIASNAAGGLNPAMASGTLMVIRDHLNFIGDNPLRGPNMDEWGPRFPDLSQAYDPVLIERALHCATRRLQLPDVITGVYAGVPGPSLETPAETRFLRNSGADGVGMSTIPEVIVARHAGIRVLGISVISNVNDPDNFKPIILEEIIDKTRQSAARLKKLLLTLLEEI
jgi:purine-nucleoside phosphorylase